MIRATKVFLFLYLFHCHLYLLDFIPLTVFSPGLFNRVAPMPSTVAFL